MTKKLESVLEALWKRSRFASYFYQSVHLVEESALPTLALGLRSSRLVLYFNPGFVERIGVEEAIGLLVHELLHVVLNHDHRARPEGNLYLQNLAQDMVVNSYLTERRESFFSRTDRYDDRGPPLVLPPGLPRIPKAFFDATSATDPTWEEVYVWLRAQPEEKATEYRGTSDTTSSLNIPLEGTSAHRPKDILQFAPLPQDRIDPGEATRFGELTGLVLRDDEEDILPTGIHLFHGREEMNRIDSKKSRVLSLAAEDRDCVHERSFQEIRAIIDRIRRTDTKTWQNQLKSIVDFSAHSSEWTYSHARFNRRYFAEGILAAGRVFRQQELLTVAVDVSGSMVTTPSEIEAAFGAIEDLLGKYRVHLVCLDENLFVPEKREDAFSVSRDLSRPYVYAKGDWKCLRTGTGGTTFFAPLFNGYMKGHREVLLVITDGYVYDLPALRRYSPTIWLVSRKRPEPFVPPFGQCVTMQARDID